ncbi:MAG: VanZ family protein [Vibrio sp.]|uniref:VanZ family protein n=1 Tax=Vibrio sp. TaxID=678 RepID=UPI003A8578C1
MRLLKYTLLALYTLLITYVSLANDSSPNATLPDLDSYGIPNLDKMAHAGAYALFIVIAMMSFGIKRRITIAIAVLFFGVILELLQAWVPLREPSLADFIADAVGVLLGILLIHGLSVLPQSRFTAIIALCLENNSK